jgi:sugar/nucleoside kinase (ribokinase family)
MDLLIAGSLALDTIETPFGKREFILGGSGTFVSTSASYFNRNIKLVGIVGYDFPEKELHFFKSRGIDISGLEISKTKKTFHWHGIYSRDMNNRDSITTDLNAFEDFNPVLNSEYKKSKIVCLGNVDPVIQNKIISQLENPKIIMADTMNFWIEGKPAELKETIKKVNIFVINESEARLLSGDHNLIKSAKKIMEMGPQTLIIKKGEYGALLITKNTIFNAPAYPLENVIDPTGAGDSFAGGFMGWLTKTNDFSDENLKVAVIYGSVMASLAVQEFSLEGIRNLKIADIKRRFEDFQKLVYFQNRNM